MSADVAGERYSQEWHEGLAPWDTVTRKFVTATDLNAAHEQAQRVEVLAGRILGEVLAEVLGEPILGATPGVVRLKVDEEVRLRFITRLHIALLAPTQPQPGVPAITLCSTCQHSRREHYWGGLDGTDTHCDHYIFNGLDDCCPCEQFQPQPSSEETTT